MPYGAGPPLKPCPRAKPSLSLSGAEPASRCRLSMQSARSRMQAEASERVHYI